MGDLDSIKKNSSTKNSLIIPLKNQNKSDLEKGVEWCIFNNIENISLMGFSGLREDHFLTSFFILKNYFKQIELVYFTNYCKIEHFEEVKKYLNPIPDKLFLLSLSISFLICKQMA